jgi:hypothetical protein
MDDDVAAYVYNDVAAYIDDDMAVDVVMMTSPPHTQFIDEPKWPIISLIHFFIRAHPEIIKIQNRQILTHLFQQITYPRSHTCSQQYNIISDKSQKIEI